MSEQAFRAASSGTSSVSSTSATGVNPVVRVGDTESGAGKELPAVEIKRPDIAELAEKLNDVSRSNGRDLRFQVDMQQGIAFLQVIDRETGEVIRQIPQDKTSVGLAENGVVQIRLFDDLV